MCPVCPRYEGDDIRDKGLCIHGVDKERSDVQVKHMGCQQVIGAGREREAIEGDSHFNLRYQKELPVGDGGGSVFICAHWQFLSCSRPKRIKDRGCQQG